MANPQDMTVDVTLDSIHPVTGKADFHLQPPGNLIFENDHHPGFHVRFVFTDNTGGNYCFPPDKDKDQAVSSQLGATNLCPPQGTSEVFRAIRVDGPNNSVLVVHNPNVSPILGAFGYVLWVTKDGGKTYLALDPGGVNNNGPTNRFLSLTTVIVAVAVIAVVALVLYKLNVFSRY
jgi:hypothetical protein